MTQICRAEYRGRDHTVVMTLLNNITLT